MVKGSEARRRGAASKAAGNSARVSALRIWNVAATDLSFLATDCRCCLYRKVVQGTPRPRGPFPTIFNRIDGAMKLHYGGRPTSDVYGGLRDGSVIETNRWVRSTPVVPTGCHSAIVVRGSLDAVVRFDDGTLGIADFKTIEPKSAHLELYAHQLRAYAYCVEHPARGAPVKIDRLGLLCFSPDTYEEVRDRGSLSGTIGWHEIERDDDSFMALLADVTTSFEQSAPPPPAPGCAWCRFHCGDCAAA
jgi:PD-(D/E)XK nuclease superfamily